MFFHFFDSFHEVVQAVFKESRVSLCVLSMVYSTSDFLVVDIISSRSVEEGE